VDQDDVLSFEWVERQSSVVADFHDPTDEEAGLEGFGSHTLSVAHDSFARYGTGIALSAKPFKKIVVGLDVVQDDLAFADVPYDDSPTFCARINSDDIHLSTIRIVFLLQRT